jgi:hypothetical protein
MFIAYIGTMGPINLIINFFLKREREKERKRDIPNNMK